MNADEPTMILVPLQETKIGENTKRVLGTLLMKEITNVFMSRADLAASERKQTLIIIDEFADLAGGEIGIIVNKLLAQARKFGASVVLATQSLTQLPPAVRMEVQTNTNNKIIWRPADLSDAQLAHQLLGDDLLIPTDFLSIERFFGYARTLVRSAPQPPFYFRTLPPTKMWEGYGPRRKQTQESKPDLTEIDKLNCSANENPKAILKLLVALPEEEWNKIVDAQVRLSQWHHRSLMHSTIPNVGKALELSKNHFGFPWWLYEASYRRQRFDKKELTS